jgi:lambda family phage portal protein
MKILDYFKRKKATKKRNYDAGAISRLLNGWTTSPKTADEAIRGNLRNMRTRSRDLSRNNDYAKKYTEMVKTNVIGPNGIIMQSKAKQQDGRFDTLDNNIVETAWKRWGHKSIASINGKLSWVDIQRCVIETVARDGEILIRKIRGASNPFGYALQLIEGDHLDEELNKDLQNGNRLKMGVEIDEWEKPVNYWLLEKHPGEMTATLGGRHYNRVPAEDLIHLFITNRPGQSRGVPWLASAMTRLHQIGEYEEAEVVAARVSACKMGFFRPDGGGEGYIGDDVDSLGNTISEAAPGAFELLPPGMEFSAFDPTHPSGNFAPFIKSTLRGIASGLNVSYNSLASDLEGVNFSSIRSGVLEERQNWRVIQSWLLEHFHQDIYLEWLRMAFINGQLGNIPQQRFDKFASPRWQTRGWEWVDPLKDAKANLQELQMGTKSRSDILAEKGKDIEEVFAQLKAESDMAEAVGIDINAVNPIEEMSDGNN